MRTVLPWLGALLCAGIMISVSPRLARAEPFYSPCIYRIPDACGPGYYTVNQCGAVYGPNYCLYPSFPPFNGVRPCFKQEPPKCVTHPFARSPRDFFMLD